MTKLLLAYLLVCAIASVLAVKAGMNLADLRTARSRPPFFVPLRPGGGRTPVTRVGAETPDRRSHRVPDSTA